MAEQKAPRKSNWVTYSELIQRLLDSRGTRTYLHVAQDRYGDPPRPLDGNWVYALATLGAVALAALPVTGANRLGFGETLTGIVGLVYFGISLFSIAHAIVWLNEKRARSWEENVKDLAGSLEYWDNPENRAKLDADVRGEQEYVAARRAKRAARRA